MCIASSLSLVVFGIGTALVENAQFAPPVPLRANGEVISVTTGHAAPYIYDFDGDGIQDLLVGEFGNKTFKGETSGKATAGHPWTAGKLRVYRNHGTDTDPVYKDFSYVQAGGQDAQVPITCCVSFVPQFVDINDDGRDDIVTGSYQVISIFTWQILMAAFMPPSCSVTSRASGTSENGIPRGVPRCPLDYCRDARYGRG